MKTVSDAAAKTLARNAAEAAHLLKQLANDRRLMILCSLMDRECTVGDLAKIAGLSHSAVSQHLMKLRESGLVAAEKQGQTVRYRLSSMPARALLTTLYLIYCKAPLSD